MYFSSDFCWYFIHLDIVHLRTGVDGGGVEGRGEGLLNRQNLLSVAKVICQQFLNASRVLFLKRKLSITFYEFMLKKLHI